MMQYYVHERTRSDMTPDVDFILETIRTEAKNIALIDTGHLL